MPSSRCFPCRDIESFGACQLNPNHSVFPVVTLNYFEPVDPAF